MKYFSKEIIIPIAGLIAIVLLVYMEKIWSVVSRFNADTITAIASVVVATLALWVSMRADMRNEEQARLSNERSEKHANLLNKRSEKQARLSNERRERQAKLSVLPLLSVINEISVIKDVNIKGDLHYKIILSNQGVGPAIIKKFELLFDGETVVLNDTDAYENFLDNKTKEFTDRNFRQRTQGSVIKVGERLILWEFNHREDQDTSEVAKLGLRIEYESIYRDEVFTLSVRDY